MRRVSLWSGLRYQFGSPAKRLRPSVEGGVIATKFIDIQRGPKDACILTGGNCIVIAPELFHGTRITGYVDFGADWMLNPTWDLRAGIKLYPLRGDETDTAPTTPFPGEPTVHDLFWHNPLYVSLVYRWQ